MMSMAPTFDLLLECCTADHTAKAIVSWGFGPMISTDRNQIRTPGSAENTKGTTEEILKNIEILLRVPRFGKWTGSTNVDKKNDSDLRYRTRADLRHFVRNQ